jgi:hypothetical protein
LLLTTGDVLDSRLFEQLRASRCSALFKLEHVNGNWLADQLTRLRPRTRRSRASSPTPVATPETGHTRSHHALTDTDETN